MKPSLHFAFNSGLWKNREWLGTVKLHYSTIKQDSSRAAKRCAHAFVFLLAAILIARAGAQTSPSDYSVQKKFRAYILSSSGQLSTMNDGQSWALSRGDRVPVRQTIFTGPDGYGLFEIPGGSRFAIFPNSRAIFRQNTGNADDLLDVLSGRMRVDLHPANAGERQRIYTPSAIITASEPATISIAVDEDDTVRIDVLEGFVKVQHTLLPRTSPVLIHAVDALVVEPDQPISYSVGHSFLYRYTIEPIVELWNALRPKDHHQAAINSKFVAMNFRSLPL